MILIVGTDPLKRRILIPDEHRPQMLGNRGLPCIVLAHAMSGPALSLSDLLRMDAMNSLP
jgi:hypothetical protein